MSSIDMLFNAAKIGFWLSSIVFLMSTPKSFICFSTFPNFSMCSLSKADIATIEGTEGWV